jgi:hypothetical protein
VLAFLATVFAVALSAHHLWWVRRQRAVPPAEAPRGRIIDFTRALDIVERYQDSGRRPPRADLEEVFLAYEALLDRDYSRTEQLRALQRVHDNLLRHSPAEQRGAPPYRTLMPPVRFAAKCTTCLRDLTSAEIEFVRHGGIFEASEHESIFGGENHGEAEYTCLCSHCGSQVEMTGPR